MPTLKVIAKTLHGTRDGVLTHDSGSPVLILDGTPFSPQDLRAHLMPVDPPDDEAMALLASQRKVSRQLAPAGCAAPVSVSSQWVAQPDNGMD